MLTKGLLNKDAPERISGQKMCTFQQNKIKQIKPGIVKILHPAEMALNLPGIAAFFKDAFSQIKMLGLACWLRR